MNNYKTLILSAALALGFSCNGAAQTTSDKLFEYPSIPENLETLSDRSNFFIENFWKRANLKSAFSSLGKLRVAFGDYVNLMPYADAEVVHKSIDELLAQVNKNPKNLLSLAEIAEGALYADSANIICDECYLPFAQAVAKSGKYPRRRKPASSIRPRCLKTHRWV